MAGIRQWCRKAEATRGGAPCGVPPRRSHQFLDPAEVLNEPHAGGSTCRRNCSWLGRRLLQSIVRLLENAPVGIELREQPIAARPGCQLMRMSRSRACSASCSGLISGYVDVSSDGVLDDDVSGDNGCDGNCPSRSNSGYEEFLTAMGVGRDEQSW